MVCDGIKNSYTRPNGAFSAIGLKLASARQKRAVDQHRTDVNRGSCTEALIHGSARYSWIAFSSLDALQLQRGRRGCEGGQQRRDGELEAPRSISGGRRSGRFLFGLGLGA